MQAGVCVVGKTDDVAIEGEFGAVWVGGGEDGSTTRCLGMLPPHSVLYLPVPLTPSRA